MSHNFAYLKETFTSEATFLMGDHIRKLSDAQAKVSDEDRDKHISLVPQDVHQDPLLVAFWT